MNFLIVSIIVVVWTGGLCECQLFDGNGGGGGPVKHDIEVNQASEFHQIVEDTE